MSGSNPPSTSGSPCIARRALTTSAVAVLAVALPVVLVAAIAAFASSATAEPAPERAGGGLIVARSASVATAADIKVPTTDAPTTTAPPPATTIAPPSPPTTVAAPPPPAPAPAQPQDGDPNDPASWDRLAQCESGSNWATNTGNGYYGGIQFSLSSWRGVGGTGYPHEASRETQIEMGKRLHAQGGWGHWPGCTRSFGWR